MFGRRIALRNLLELVCALCFVVALALVPLADLTALGKPRRSCCCSVPP
ncbi:hypothetical protein [Devosia aurantiaca]|uniref:Uncharacterized protein n=1 Tax=Devosia aurantiaca TaxID=2714858 RepID=A0A6M1SN53_9HYPH|nr:hypothetical protein [Devosia aurantiaca]NGP16932.1 hypothetical protein [Devosia aurantiaca]